MDFTTRNGLFSILIELFKSDEKCFTMLILVVKTYKKHCVFLTLELRFLKIGGGWVGFGCRILCLHPEEDLIAEICLQGGKGGQKSENITNMTCEPSLLVRAIFVENKFKTSDDFK